MTPITGSIVALATPMHEDGSVDYHKVGSEGGKPTHEKQYAAEKIS